MSWLDGLVLDLSQVVVVVIAVLRIWQMFIFPKISRYKPKSRSTNKRYYIYSTRNRSHRIALKKSTRPTAWLIARTTTTEKPSTMHPFDSDSFEIAIDNCASANFTNNLADYVTKQSTKAVVHGIGNKDIRFIGTVRWKLQDDRGRVHTLTIPNVYYVPTLPWRLLSPQTLAQVLNDPHGTGCLTLGDRMELFWNRKQFQKTIPLTSSNIAITRSAPSNDKFYAFASTIPNPTPSPHIIPFELTELDTTQTTDLESPRGNTNQTNARTPHTSTTGTICTETSSTLDKSTNQDQTKQDHNLPRNDPIAIDFNDTLEPQTTTIPNDMTAQQWMILKLHYRLGHISMHRIKQMAKMGLIPKKIADIQPPMCASCQFGKATRRPWRTKALPSQAAKLKPITGPGSCVSVDQMESPTPGLIAQLKGILTTKRYRVATIFVDHYSRFSYVYLQTSTSAKETLEAKQSFEAYCQQLGVRVMHYHADNGRFADNDWLADIARSRQTITFCGVGAHFQNGVAEKRIRDLQENARTMLLQAELRWPKAHSTALWPYAVRHANNVMNCTPRTDNNDKSPIEMMTGSDVRPKLNDFHNFGCPIYVLQNPLQSNKSVGKWNSRARVGIYLGMSPRHARSVSLVLNPRTGLVSPQWHVKHDDMFETVATGTIDQTHGLWKQLAGFAAGKVKQQSKKGKERRVLQVTTPSEREEQIVPDIIPNEGEVFFPAADEMPENEGDQVEVPTEMPAEGPHQPQRRSTRTWKPTQRFLESVEQEEIALPTHLEVLAVQYEQDDNQDINDPFAFAAKHSDPDSFYYHQAMKQPDAPQFQNAMQKEVDDHEEKGNWEIVERVAVPIGTKILDAVWAMKRKRKILTQEIYKWKARINLHGGQQIKGIHFCCTRCTMVNNQINPHPCVITKLAYTTVRFCAGIPASSC